MATADQIIRACMAVDARGGGYVFGAKGYRNFDCSGFTHEVARQCGINIPHGSVNQKDWAVRNRKIVSVSTALRTKGAMLFRMNTNPKHVAFSLGNGSTYEARSRSTGIGVFGGASRRVWTHGAIIASGGAHTPAPAPPANANAWVALAQAIKQAKRYTYRRGNRHPNIKFAQVKLNECLKPGNKLTVDGAFGDRTFLVMIAFQKCAGLTQDGVLGPKTWNALWPNI